ncbi:MAG TPA: MarR family transcriptional regulator [Galbitalea sp.]|jgi:DNA-binding MarR family transcriptional regulator
MTDPAPNSAAWRLAFIVGRMNRRLANATGGLSHGLLSALATVAKHGSVRLVELGQIEMVSAPSVTRVVAELEYRKLVVRTVDEDDRRAFRIEVTPAGADAVMRARAARSEVVADLLAGLSPDEAATIEAALPALEKVIGLT